MGPASRIVIPLALAMAAGQAEAQSTRLLTRADYESRLRGLWLGECIANWTGLRTEASRTSPPFFTDADWGTQPPGAHGPIVFVTELNPWRADDDTDIEYVYTHLVRVDDTNELSPDNIRDGWIEHINRSAAKHVHYMSTGCHELRSGCRSFKNSLAIHPLLCPYLSPEMKISHLVLRRLNKTPHLKHSIISGTSIFTPWITCAKVLGCEVMDKKIRFMNTRKRGFCSFKR